PQPEHRGAIGDDGHRVVLHGEGEGPLTIVADGQAHAGDTRCVHHGEVVPGADGHLVLDLDLPAQVHQERAVRDVDDPYPGDVTEAGDDLLAMDAVPGLDRDVPDDPITQGPLRPSWSPQPRHDSRATFAPIREGEYPALRSVPSGRDVYTAI